MRSLRVLSLCVVASACTTDDPSAQTDATEASGTSTDPSGDTTEDTSGDTTGGGTDKSGEELYLLLCVSCHGPDAMGTTLGYELRHPRREFARWVIRNGRASTELAPSVMAAYPQDLLPDADVDKIFDYLDGFPTATDGEGLYLDHCRNCHGTDAAGGEAEKDIRFEVAGALEKVREGEGGTDYAQRTGYMSSWSAAELSDADVALIVTYVQSL